MGYNLNSGLLLLFCLQALPRFALLLLIKIEVRCLSFLTNSTIITTTEILLCLMFAKVDMLKYFNTVVSLGSINPSLLLL